MRPVRRAARQSLCGSEQAAKATAACAWLERTLPRATEDSDEEEDEGREEREEVARVRYKHALRKLAEAFPELEIPAGLYITRVIPIFRDPSAGYF